MSSAPSARKSVCFSCENFVGTTLSVIWISFPENGPKDGSKGKNMWEDKPGSSEEAGFIFFRYIFPYFKEKTIRKICFFVSFPYHE